MLGVRQMLGLGLAVSHAPSMFRGLADWPAIHRAAYRPACRSRRKSRKKLRRYCKVISPESICGFEVLREQVEAFNPDVLLVVGDDQGEVFTEANMPTFGLFTCAEVHGSINIGLIGEPEEENHIRLRCAADLARHLLSALNRRGFAISEIAELKPLGRPKRGLGHAFTRPTVKVTPKLNVPIVPFHVNCYFPPMPSARKCYELGGVIAEVLKDRPEKGGDHGCPADFPMIRADRARVGSMRRWIVGCLSSYGLATAKRDGLFESIPSTLRGGTGEIRSWIVVAAACRERCQGLPSSTISQHITP